MNALAWLVLVALLGRFVLMRAAAALDLRAYRSPMPPDLEPLTDPDAFSRTGRYLTARTRLGAIAATSQLAALLVFWAAGCFAWWQDVVAGAGWGPVFGGVAFVAGLLAAQSILGLPFAWWSTFRVEQRFGFNRTTPGTWIADRARGLALAALLGLPLLAAIVWLFSAGGPWAWLWAYLLVAGVQLLLTVVAPTWIMPLFHRFDPLAAGPLRDRIEALCGRLRFPLDELFVIDGSRRSTKANAFFTGLGRRKRIALFDTLVERHEPPEVAAVVAHEIGHYALGHIPRGVALSLLTQLALFAALGWLLAEPALYAAFGLAEVAVGPGLVFASFVLIPAELALSIPANAWSRRNEFAADRFAVEAVGGGADLAAALTRLSRDSLANLAPHRLSVWLHASHPPLRERLAALQVAATASRPG